MKDIIIIGGGLAGLSCSLDLKKRGYDVLLIEKNTYPFHRVCGEFISNEVLPYLNSIGVRPHDFGAKKISQMLLSSPSGEFTEITLPVHSFGISRYKLDEEMMREAQKNGVEVVENTTVMDIMFENDVFTVKTNNNLSFQSKVVVGSFGKRSNLDRIMQRAFFYKRSPYVGVKYHYKYNHPENLVCLHNFEGGYCGVSMVENDHVNVCYLVERTKLKEHGTIEELEKNIISKNPHLAKLFKEGIRVFKQPITINEISFSSKKAVEKHVLMVGDAAGMITPLAGNGMAMAIRSAYEVCPLIDSFLKRDIERTEMEVLYQKKWNELFKKRLHIGKLSQPLFGKKTISNLSLKIVKKIPRLLTKIVSHIHQKPFLHEF
jgi:menaquinone-9 beta-reductase